MGKFYILISENADSCIKHIASSLQSYIEKCTGIELPISTNISNGNYLSIGKTKGVNEKDYNNYLMQIKNEGFIIVPYMDNILFIGETDRELAYSVYDYLEKYYGIRFLKSDCEYIPEKRKIVVPDRIYISDSDFYMRTYLTADVFQKTADYDFILKTKTNDVFTTLPDEYGGRNNVYGRDSNHNFHCYVPFEVYGNTHPEFYRFFYVNGELNYTIDLTNGIDDNGELDESMEISVAKIVIDELKKDMDENPSIKVFNFTQEDGDYPFNSERTDKFVKKYKRSGILIRFCNLVVRKLNEYGKEKLNGRQIKLVTFAYRYTEEAPVKQENGRIVPIDNTVICDKNLIIQLALFTNGKYSFLSDKQPEEIKKSFNEWKILAKEFWFWGYDIDFHRYLAFYDSFRTIKQNVLELKNYGITYLCVNGPYESHTNWQADIRAYAYRKLMWDSSLSVENLIDEYIDIYYGKAGQEVKDVIKMFEDHFDSLESKGKDLTFTVRGNGSDCENVPFELINKCIDKIKQGENKFRQEDDNEYIKRLERIVFSLEFFLFDNFQYYYKDKTLEEIRAMKEELFKRGREAGIDYVGERWTIDQQEEEVNLYLKQL